MLHHMIGPLHVFQWNNINEILLHNVNDESLTVRSSGLNELNDKPRFDDLEICNLKIEFVPQYLIIIPLVSLVMYLSRKYCMVYKYKFYISQLVTQCFMWAVIGGFPSISVI